MRFPLQPIPRWLPVPRSSAGLLWVSAKRGGLETRLKQRHAASGLPFSLACGGIRRPGDCELKARPRGQAVSMRVEWRIRQVASDMCQCRAWSNMAFGFAPASAGAIAASTRLERDDFSYNRHPARSRILGMVSAQTRSAFVAVPPGAERPSGGGPRRRLSRVSS